MRRAFLWGGLLLGLAACDPERPKIQYMPDMADSPTVKPQESYLNPPPHSIAMDAVLYPKGADEAEKAMSNPIAPGTPVASSSILTGKQAYETYCYACHGADGKGGGPVTQDVFGGAIPNIVSPDYAERGDGFFFHRITYGVGRMPAYGEELVVEERWRVVHYLRELQQ